MNEWVDLQVNRKAQLIHFKGVFVAIRNLTKEFLMVSGKAYAIMLSKNARYHYSIHANKLTFGMKTNKGGGKQEENVLKYLQ